jgi:hypothetical protein
VISFPLEPLTSPESRPDPVTPRAPLLFGVLPRPDHNLCGVNITATKTELWTQLKKNETSNYESEITKFNLVTTWRNFVKSEKEQIEIRTKNSFGRKRETLGFGRNRCSQIPAN